MNSLTEIKQASGPVGRLSIKGTFIHVMTLTTVENSFLHFLQERRQRQIVTVNLDFLTLAESIPELKQLINQASLALTDGAPLVWLARRLGFSDVERVTGPDLIELAARLSATQGFKIFLLGSTQHACETTKAVLQERFPGSIVCGMYAPPEATY